VLAGIRGTFRTSVDDVEVTVECNPSSLDRPEAAALREAGVDRLSVGVQSLSDERLRFLGRFHDATGALAALQAALAEVDRVSADLMFGMPGQTWSALRDDLARVLDLGVRHVSSYALTIEPGTQFGELHRKGRLDAATEDDYADMYLGAAALMAERGLDHYEVSNWAEPGEESRHNQHYWRGGAYLGLGAAAVGCLDAGPGRARRWRNEPVGERYLEREPDATEVWEEVLDADALVRESLMLGLRTREGTSLTGAARRAGVDPLAGRERALARRVEAGDVVHEGDHLRVPRDRWLRLDGIVADLF